MQVIKCGATQCVSNDGCGGCKRKTVKIYVMVGTMSKEQYDAKCEYFITRQEQREKNKEKHQRERRMAKKGRQLRESI